MVLLLKQKQSMGGLWENPSIKEEKKMSLGAATKGHNILSLSSRKQWIYFQCPQGIEVTFFSLFMKLNTNYRTCSYRGSLDKKDETWSWRIARLLASWMLTQSISWALRKCLSRGFRRSKSLLYSCSMSAGQLLRVIFQYTKQQDKNLR